MFRRAFSISVICLATIGCSSHKAEELLTIDGSSTVFPLTEAVAEAFEAQHKGRIAVGVSGTGGGFKKLCEKDIGLSGASRPIKPSETSRCAKNQVDTIEIPVAYDGIAVVVHPENTWVTSLTVQDLKKIWQPEAQGKVMLWSDVRPSWPQKPLHLFGPGIDSGTYDYFTKAIVGKEHTSRGDFTSSEDDNVLVRGVAHDVNALGFFGYGYYAHNRDSLKLIPIDDGIAANGAGPILPSPQTVANGTYQPLSRPVFLYVSKEAAQRPQTGMFVQFFLKEGPALAPEVGLMALSPKAYGLAQAHFEARRVGSRFGAYEAGQSIEDVLSRR